MKTIVIGDITYAMTPEKIRRIKDAIEDTKRSIARHNRRRPEDRDQQMLNSWADHIKKLEGFLEGAEE
jgi:hypothetical protein